MITKNYCKKCNTERWGRKLNVRCSICGKMFLSNHRPIDTVCKECTEKMMQDDVYKCRACLQNIDSSTADENTPVGEEKDKSRAYRRNKTEEKKRRDLKMTKYTYRGKLGKNGKYLVEGELPETIRIQKSKSTKKSRHQNKQDINRGLREGFTYDDLDDIVGGKVKFNKNKGNFY